MPMQTVTDRTDPAYQLTKRIADTLLKSECGHAPAMSALLTVYRRIALVHPCCRDSAITCLQEVMDELSSLQPGAGNPRH